MDKHILIYSYSEKLHSNKKGQTTGMPKDMNGTPKHTNEWKTDTK